MAFRPILDSSLPATETARQPRGGPVIAGSSRMPAAPRRTSGPVGHVYVTWSPKSVTAGKALLNHTARSPVPLAISRTNADGGRRSRSTRRIESRLRAAAGALLADWWFIRGVIPLRGRAPTRGRIIIGAAPPGPEGLFRPPRFQGVPSRQVGAVSVHDPSDGLVIVCESIRVAGQCASQGTGGHQARIKRIE
jgi:hypothetical protein